MDRQAAATDMRGDTTRGDTQRRSGGRGALIRPRGWPRCVALAIGVQLWVLSCGAGVEAPAEGADQSELVRVTAPIRIEAGGGARYVDPKGRTWVADIGFVDGKVVDRGAIAISGTDSPKLYQTERWGLSAYRFGVPNGRYNLRLHFAETFENVEAAGTRVFRVTVQGEALPDVDVFAQAGGRNRALIREVRDVAVTGGVLNIEFTAIKGQPLVNAIEIIARSAPSPDVRGRPVISNGTLRTDTGQIMRAGRVSSSEAAARDPAMWARARALGLNTLRVGFTVGDKSMPAVFALLDPIVAAARNNRMYVMLCNAETKPGDWTNNKPANRAKSIANWRAVAPRYANEEHVFYEMINEPEEWGLWSHYASSPTAPTELLVALRAVHDVIRAEAPNTPVLVPSPGNLHAPDGVTQYVAAIQAFESLGPVNWSRTVWSFHYYNRSLTIGISNDEATDGGRAAFNWLKARYPIVVTETNWWMEPPRDVLIDAADALEDANVGWTIMRYPGQPGSSPNPFAGDLFPDPLTRKVAQLRARGFTIPTE